MGKGNTAAWVIGGLAVAGLVYAGVSNTKQAAEQLRFGVSSFRLGNIKIFTSDLSAILRAENPAATDVVFNDVQVNVDLIYNGQTLGNINQTSTLQIPAKGVTYLPVAFRLSHLGVGKAILEAFRGNIPAEIHMQGTIKYAGITSPVNVTKELSV